MSAPNASGSVVAYHDPDSRYENEYSEVVGEPEIEQDTAKLRKIQEWWRQAREAQAANRLQMAMDRDFYDSLQLSDEERSTLINRGQPPVVKNLIAPAMDWILGTEKRTRMDYKAFPRKDSGEANEDAINKTKLLKYIDDVNKATFARSQAFEDSVIVGLGWLEDGVRNDETDELIFARRESWRNIWYDHLSVERNLSDARYLFREKWVDLDVAKAMFPQFKRQLEEAAISHNSLGETDDDEFYALSQLYTEYDSQGYQIARTHIGEPGDTENHRERVKLVEAWYRMPQKVTMLRDRGFDSKLAGREYDPQDENQTRAVYEEIVSTYDTVIQKMNVCIFCEDTLLQDLPSPYRHNDFPFTPVWGKRRGRDNAPYGAVRSMIDGQRDYNARSSKALFILSVNRVVAEVSSVLDWDEVREQAAAPDGIIRLADGVGASNARFEIDNDRSLAREHLQLMDMDSEFMQRASGVSNENMGLDTSAESGKAILAKQTEGSVVTYLFFDNLGYAMQIAGEKRLSNIEQFYDMEKTVRIVGEGSRQEFVTLNQVEQDPFTGETVIKNDVTAFTADFLISTQDYRQTVRQAQQEVMMEMLTRMPPEVSIQLLDLVVEMSDISNKEEWVKRLRMMNGHRDPNEIETPEEQQERQAAEEQEAIKQQQEHDQIEAEIEKLRSESARLRAETEKRKAEVARNQAETTLTKVESVHKATETAATMASIPSVAHVADEVLESSGFDDESNIGLINVPKPEIKTNPSTVKDAKEFLNPTKPQEGKNDY